MVAYVFLKKSRHVHAAKDDSSSAGKDNQGGEIESMGERERKRRERERERERAGEREREGGGELTCFLHYFHTLHCIFGMAYVSRMRA